MEKKEDFYHELDTKGRRVSFCTCQTLALGFLCLAVGMAILVVLGVKKVSNVVMPRHQVISTQADAIALQNKLAELSKAPGASTSLAITEPELTSLFVAALGKNPAVPLKSVQVEIVPEAVIIHGITTKYLTSSVDITTVPKVVDGRVRLELVKIQAGTMAVPAVLTDLLAKSLSSVLDEALNTTTGITVKSVQLVSGRMLVSGLNSM